MKADPPEWPGAKAGLLQEYGLAPRTLPRCGDAFWMPEVLKIMKMIGKVDPLKSVGFTWEIAVNKYLFLVGPVIDQHL